MARVYEISFRLGAQMAGDFAKTMQSGGAALGQLNQRIAEIGKNQSSLAQLTKLRQQVGESSREYNQARQRVAELGKAISNTANPTKEMTRQFERAKREVSQAKTRLDQKRESLRQLNTTLGTTGQSTAELVRRQEELAKSAEQARKAQTNLQDAISARDANMQKRGQLRGQMMDAVALAATLAAPIKVAMDFEQSMAKVGAVSRASGEDLKRLTGTARELGATTNWSASQAADGMQFLAMAGFNTNQTIAAMPGMLDLASAGAIDLGSAADIASNILSGFSMEAEQMGRLGDVLTSTFTSSNTNLNMLGETMKYVAPIANATGVSLEQAAAMTGKLGDAGIQGSKAGTALRAVINRLAAPSGEAAKAINQLGIDVADADGNMRDVPTILAEMDEAMRNMGSAARAEMTSAVFGMEAASAATILLGQAGSGSLQQYTSSLMESGAAARVANEQNNTAAGAMRRLGSASESIGITLGNVLLPPLARMAELFATGIGVVDSLAQQFPVLTQVVVIGTAALIALKIATIAGGYAWTFIKGAWLSGVVALRTVQAALTLARLRLIGFSAAQVAAAAKTKLITAAQWLWNAAMTANPIGLIIAGIAGLVAAGVALYKNWDRVSAFFTATWERIKGLFMKFHPLGWVLGGFSKLLSFLNNFSLFSSGAKILQTMASGIRSAVGAPIEAVKGALQRVRNYLPFSDAKVGPLSQLTASGQSILETLGKGMEQVSASKITSPLSVFGSALKALPGLPGAALDSMASRATGGGQGQAGGGTGVTVHLTQEININGAGQNVAEQARAGAAAGVQDLATQMQQILNNERRLSYA